MGVEGSCIILEGVKKTTKTLRIIDVPVEGQTGRLQNTNLSVDV
jgi:hypothetical protein